MLNPVDARPQLLVTVLDWGMGHATRTLPLIEHAVAQGWHVHVASKGTALAWLQAHLDAEHVAFHTKPGPDIKYAKRGNFLRIAGQVPSFLAHVEIERRWVAEFAVEHNIDAIFSDNCYGCSTPDLPSVLMSHQLQLPVPKGLEGAARQVVARWARGFDEVWVPDTVPGEDSLSGGLAEADIHPQTHYIGVLSRLARYARPNPEVTWERVGMVSGVEPHRSLMEQALRAWMHTTDQPCLIVAGKPGGGTSVEGNVTTWCDPTDAELADALQGAGTLLCRSGYSSQLDLAALHRNAILVPTPGQPEQEQLARIWADRFGFTTLSQRDLEAGRIPERATGNLPNEAANELAFQELTRWLLASIPTHA
ncbi:MAG: hypothetical protein O2990_07840 [Bacteroidetes bacterium]|nr:hypothetical protein [Bacteroidota bacterium]